jgi:tRNA (uracil-5-)-methyltransferase TRM9
MKNQQKIWDKIAPEWNKYRIDSKELNELLKGQKGRILDLGSGSGRSLINLKTKGEMYLVDFSENMIKLAKKRAKNEKIKAKFFVSDISKLPFKDNFFDFAISIASLHCLTTKRKRKKAVKELFRVLKSGAKAKIAVWNKDTDRYKNAPKVKYINWKNKGKRYYYLYDEKEVHKLFKKVGFIIKKACKPNKNIIFIVQKP